MMDKIGGSVVNVYKLLQIENASKRDRKIFVNYLTLTTSTSTILLFSRTFFVIYIIDKLGIAALAVLYAISYGTQALIDYPTGNLQSKIGANKVYFISILLYSSFFFMLPFAGNYLQFGLLFMIEGLARSQESGTLTSWFDKTYNHIMAENDPNYKMYVEFNGTLMIVDTSLNILMAVVGGFLATYLTSGRRAIFFIQALALVLLAFYSLRTIKKYYKEDKKETETKSDYSGLKFILNKPNLILFLVVIIIDFTTSSIWLDILMFPIIYGYTGSDFLSSVLVLAVFIVTIFFILLAEEIGKKAKLIKWVPISLLIQTIFTFGGAYILLNTIDMKNKFNLGGCISLIFIITAAAFAISLFELLTKKFYIDVIPDKVRNSFYSLLPTLTLVAAAAMNFIVSDILERFSISFLILIVIVLRLIASGISVLSLKGYKQKITPDIIIKTEFPYIFDRELKDVSRSYTYFKPTDWYMSETVKNIWVQLLETVKLEENVPEDALNLLTDTMINLDIYLKLLERGLEDGKLNAEEKEDLENKRMRILYEVIRKANEDNVITEIEQNFIDKLKEILEELNKIEKATFHE